MGDQGEDTSATGSGRPGSGERASDPGGADPQPPLVLTTRRLVLRPVDRDLAEDIVAARRGGDWAEGFPQEGDVRASRIACLALATGESGPSEGSGWGAWAVRRAGVLIGTAGFHGPPDLQGRVEVGYGLAPEHRGQGLGREAVSALLAWAAAHGVVSAAARVDPGNEASLRLLARLGFRLDGRDDAQLRLVHDLP